MVLTVEATGFEPAASASRTQRSTKLSHASMFLRAFAPLDCKTYFNREAYPCQRFFRVIFISTPEAILCTEKQAFLPSGKKA